MVINYSLFQQLTDVMLNESGKVSIDAIKAVETIIKAVWEIKLGMRSLDEKYHREMAEYKSRLKAVQDSCPHQVTKFNEDPSGNNDGFHECIICRKEI